MNIIITLVGSKIFIINAWRNKIVDNKGLSNGAAKARGPLTYFSPNKYVFRVCLCNPCR
jgi:hypothetical protein